MGCFRSFLYNTGLVSEQETKPEIFECHNSEDKPAVRAPKKWRRERIDRWADRRANLRAKQ
jgi:hypothetical protein